MNNFFERKMTRSVRDIQFYQLKAGKSLRNLKKRQYLQRLKKKERKRALFP